MKVDRCPTCRRRIKRSSEQNRRLWALYHAMSEKLKPDGQTFSADTFHLWAKSKFLGAVDHKLPGGKVVTILNSTSDLDVDEFNDYMSKIEAFANSKGVFLEDKEGWS